ncbi:hypothetical protein Tco_0644637 [Tanacetum coccineum]
MVNLGGDLMKVALMNYVATQNNDFQVVKNRMDATKVVDESDTDVCDVYDEKNQFMASLSKEAGGGANDASFLEDEDVGIVCTRQNIESYISY